MLTSHPKLWSTVKIVGLHLFLLLAAFSVLLFLGYNSQMPAPDNLSRWDVGWYLSIVENGYVYQEGQSNVAFFPFFPFLWKALSLGMRGISVLNAFLFLGSFIWLAQVFKLSRLQILFFLSVPSIMFMYVPYSEASFFLFSTILLVGLYKNNNYLILAGLFLCCVTRSSAVFFVPAVIFTQFISFQGTNKAGVSRILYQTLLYLGAVAAAILFVGLVQWQQTGQWFPFFGVQQYWKHEFKLPVYPLTTWGGTRLLWLDGPALWFGISAGLFCVYVLVRFFRESMPSIAINRAAVFSAGYVVAVALFIIFFQQHSIYSLNRYVFATPYFIVFLLTLVRQFSFSLKALCGVFLASLPLWLLFEAHERLDGMSHLQTVWYFILITLDVTATLTLNQKHLNRHVIPVLYGINILLQLYLFDIFLKGEWVG
ncbi:MAG: hypothetical protein LPJ89_02540 [Hymenobacteraceae bacterium]|nr:hypothetical protein [Hymenobacteraceae bacterium]